MCLTLKLKGPLCIQIKKDTENNLKIIEVNPRFGGGTFFTTLAGCNFMKFILDDLENKKNKVLIPNQITVVRYFEEIVLKI